MTLGADENGPVSSTDRAVTGGDQPAKAHRMRGPRPKAILRGRSPLSLMRKQVRFRRGLPEFSRVLGDHRRIPGAGGHRQPVPGRAGSGGTGRLRPVAPGSDLTIDGKAVPVGRRWCWARTVGFSMNSRDPPEDLRHRPATWSNGPVRSLAACPRCTRWNHPEPETSWVPSGLKATACT